MAGYFVKRTNVTADFDITLMGKHFMCGAKAGPKERIGDECILCNA